MAKRRITVELTPVGDDAGEVSIYLNEAGLNLLIEELTALSKTNDHFHLGAPEWGAPDEPLSMKPYSSNVRTAGHLKVLFRPDEWDREYFPHLFESDEASQ